MKELLKGYADAKKKILSEFSGGYCFDSYHIEDQTNSWWRYNSEAEFYESDLYFYNSEEMANRNLDCGSMDVNGSYGLNKSANHDFSMVFGIAPNNQEIIVILDNSKRVG